MSSIPNSAMPHAGPASENDSEGGSGPTLSERAAKLADKARDNPKTALAGAAVVAGAIAAAAIPLVRGRKSSAKKTGSSGSSGKKRPIADALRAPLLER